MPFPAPGPPRTKITETVEGEKVGVSLSGAGSWGLEAGGGRAGIVVEGGWVQVGKSGCRGFIGARRCYRAVLEPRRCGISPLRCRRMCRGG